MFDSNVNNSDVIFNIQYVKKIARKLEILFWSNTLQLALNWLRIYSFAYTNIDRNSIDILMKYFVRIIFFRILYFIHNRIHYFLLISATGGAFAAGTGEYFLWNDVIFIKPMKYFRFSFLSTGMVVANKKCAHESQSNGIRFYYNRRWLCMDRITCNAWSGSCVPVYRFGDSNIGTQTDHAAACHSIHHWMGSSNIRHKCIDASGRPFLAWCERWCILRYGAYIYRWNCTVRHSWFTWKLLPAYVGHWCAVFIYCWCKNECFCIQFDLCHHSNHFRHNFRIYARNAIIFDFKR